MKNQQIYKNVCMNDNVALPLPPKVEQAQEMEIYARFMRHLRCVPTNRMEIKVLSAIQFTADMLDYSDEHVANVVVDLGLRAPRMAFPVDFLNHADGALRREQWEVGAASEALLELDRYWSRIGDTKKPAYQTTNTAADDTVRI